MVMSPAPFSVPALRSMLPPEESVPLMLTVAAPYPVRHLISRSQGKASRNAGSSRRLSTGNLIFALIARDVLGFNIKIVRGYQGAAPMFLAMQRGELDGQMVGLSSARTGQKDLWARKVFRPLMHFGRTMRLLCAVPLGVRREAGMNCPPSPDA